MLKLVFLMMTVLAIFAQSDNFSPQRIVRVGGIVCDDASGVVNYLQWNQEFNFTPEHSKFKLWLPQCDYYKFSRLWVLEDDFSFRKEAGRLFIVGAIRLPHSKRVRYGVVRVIPLTGEMARLWPRPFVC